MVSNFLWMRKGRAAHYGIFLNNLQEAEVLDEHNPRRMYKALDGVDLDDEKFIKLFRLNKELT